MADSLGQKFSLNGQSALRLGLWANARTPEAYPTNRIWFSNLVVRTLAGPALTALPASRTLNAGSALELTAPVGVGVFQYQWQKNGRDIEGATNGTFTLNSVTGADAGSYTVRVSDDVARTISSPCALSVQDGSQLTLAYPGMRSTYVSGLFGTNIVGFYDGYPDDEGNVDRHGFLFNGSNWTQLRPTNSLRSEARGISSNRIVGTFTDTNNRRHGYLLTNGVFTVLDYPSSSETRAYGVDGDRIVGDYRDTSSVRRAFLRTGNSWTNFSFPGAVSTSARGISGNRIVGNYTDLSGGAKGFILEGTNWTSLSYSNLILSPLNPAQTWSANYISVNSVSGNTVTGELNNSAGGTASFLYQGGAWQILSPSNLPVMIAYGIQGNRLGGFYLESPESGNWLGTVLTLPAPEITTFGQIGAVVGDPFTLSVTADNAPAGFAATNLPPGLTLNPTNGMISGTPSWGGGYLAMISASNSAGVGSKNINFYVESQQLRIPWQGSFSKQLSAPGGAASFQVSGLPGGLTLSSSGLISGTPANAGYYTATFRASNATGVFTSQIAFTVFRTNLVVTGRVVTPSNTPVANFPLRLVNPAFSGKIFASATTAANGTFQLTAPADRNYQVVQANLTNVNTLPTRFLYPVHVFNDWFGTPVDAGDIQAVAVNRTLQVRMVDAFSGEPITGTNLTRMGAAALSCGFIPLADPIAIWMLHQIQIRAQKSFWKLTAEERAGLREEASRLRTATFSLNNTTDTQEVEINWSFLQGYENKELPPVYYANMGNNWNAQDNVVFYQNAELFWYFAKTNASGLYEVPVAVLGNDPRVDPWYTLSTSLDALPEPTCAMELIFDGPEAVRGKVIARYEMVYEQGFGRPGYLSNNPLAVDLKVRPAPRTISGNFYRSNGSTAVTNGSVYLEQHVDYPFWDFLVQGCRVDSAGRFNFAVPEDAEDDWRITGEEISDTQTNVEGGNHFTSARQYLLVRSNDITGVRLIADQAPVITSIQGGAAGETFRVNGSNLACLGEVALYQATDLDSGGIIQPTVSELWIKNRGAGFVEFGLPDYLPPGQYRIQYRYPNFAANFYSDVSPYPGFYGLSGYRGFIEVNNDSNVFTVGPSSKTLSFDGFPGGLVRVPVRYADKNIYNLSLSNTSTGETQMLQPRAVTSQYLEILLPEGVGLGDWSLQWGYEQAIAGLTLNNPTPVISLNPVNQNVAEGGTANFAVGATGALPLRYQWTQNGLNVDGATNSTLTITNARSIHAGEYAAVVSNWVGSVTSAVAALSVQQAPQILGQPRGTNIIAGRSFSLTVAARGSEPLAYQWKKGGTNLEGANDSTLAFDSVSASDAGTYTVRITNAVGSVVSSNAVVTVVSPPQFAVQATNGLRATLASAFRYDPIVAGSAAVFSLSNAPAGLSVNRTNGSVTGTPTVPAYTRFAVVASNVAGTDTLALGLTVPAAPSGLPFLDEFTSVPPTNRYMKVNLGMPASLVWSNQAIRYVCATGDGDSAIAGWSPTLPLALTNSWEVSLDVQMPDGWETPSAAVGMSLFPDSPTMTLEQFNPHRLHFRLDRDTTSDIPGNRFYRCSYASGEEFPAVPYQTNPTSATLGRLRILYTTNTRTLHTLYREGTNNTAWVALGDPVNLNPSTSSSLAAAWGLSNTSGLRLVVWGDSTGTNGSARQAMTMDNLAVRAGAAPGITNQPLGTNVAVGGTATLAVTASGPDPFFYQWRCNGTNLSGATNASLRLENVQAANGGLYSAVVSNLFGSVTSSNARLTVILPPVFPPQATNGLRGNLGQAFTFAPILSNGPATFTSSNLPAGLTVNRSNGVISGTPTNAAYTRFSVTASNAAGAATLPLALTVPAAPSALPLVDGFTSSVPNRYMVADISELLGNPEYFPQAGRLSLAVTNGVLRLICPTNSLGFHSLAWVPGVSLPLSSPWEILLDVQVPNNYLTQESQLGFTVFPALQPAAALPETNSISYLKNLTPDLNFYLNRDTQFTGSLETENILERTAYINNEDQGDCHAALPFPSLTNATLRIAYRADQKTLSTWGRANPGGEWIKVGGDVDFNPANSSSLARRWDLATNSSLQFALTAYFEITDASPLPPIFADNLIVRAGVLPTIVTNPVSRTVGIGRAANFSVVPSGADPFFYQWRLNGTNLSGATNAVFGLTNAQPSSAGNYSVLVSNLFGAVTSSNAQLTVIQPPVFPPQATNGLRGNLGQAFTFAPILSNGPAVFTVAGLTNSGLTVNRTNGVISGTPTNSGYYRVTLTASNVAGTDTLPLSITVPGSRLTGALADNFSAATPNRYLPFNYYSPGSMRITNGAARFVTTADGTNGSTAGLVLNLPLSLTNSWDVSADVTLPNGWVTPEAEIGISLDTMFGTNDTLETVFNRGQEISLVLNRDTEIEGSNNVRRSVYVGGEDQESLRTTLVDDGVTNARLRFVYQTNGRTLRAWVQTNSATPWVAVGDALDMNPATGGSLAQRWGLSNGSSLFLTLTAYAEGGTGGRNLSLDNLSIGVPVPPVITSTGNLTGQVGQALIYTNRATNGVAEYGVSNLPAGLSLNPATGVITGTPENAGVFSNLILSATGPAGAGRRTNTSVILPAFTSSNTVAGFVNDAGFLHAVTVTSNNFDSRLLFAASNLPPGLSINATSGVISGRPTVVGTYSPRVTISVGAVTAFRDLLISVGQTDGSRWVVGSAVSYPVNLGTGVTGYQATGLPTGLSINAVTGLISGTPKEAGAYMVTVSVPARGLSTMIPFFIRPIYVNLAATGANNGTTWADAYTNLQTAINAAGAGAQIWVKAGTYKPTSYLDPKVTNDPRSRSFILKGGVSVLGGFAGMETQLDQRDVESNPTILSGDFNGNDSAAWPPVVGNDGNVGSGDLTRSENAYHVIGALSQTTAPILDGFTITGGNANNTSYRQPNNGFAIPAGILLHCAASAIAVVNSDFVLRNAHLIKNNGKEGPMGIYNLTGQLRRVRIADSVFETNLAYYGKGAGFSAEVIGSQNVVSRPLLQVNVVRSAFLANEARTGPDEDDDLYPDGGEGGAASLYWGVEGNFVNCAFIDNYANGKKTNGTPWYDSSSGGREGNGGAIQARRYCDLNIANSIFAGNLCDDNGGAINIESGVRLKMYFSTFYDNDSTGNERGFGAGVVFGWYGTNSLRPNTMTGYGVVAWQNPPIAQEIDLNQGDWVYLPREDRWVAPPLPAPSTLSQSIFSTGSSLTNNNGTLRNGNPNFYAANSIFGADGLYLTTDDGLRIRSGSIAQNFVSARPADFADLDEDGNTTELLPYDAAGVAYPSNPPYNAGAYQTVAP